MTTIADELLNDFEESGSEGEDQPADDLFSSADPINGSFRQNGLEAEGDEEEEVEDMAPDDPPPSHLKMEDAEDEEETKARVERMELKAVRDVRSIAGLMRQLEPVLEKIEHYQKLPPEQQTRNIGSIEDNPEYKVLTQSNTLSTSIDGEIILVHKFIRDHYSVRFPELETLVQNPLDYAKTVAIIGNGPMDGIGAKQNDKNNAVGQSLREVLAGASLMTVAAEASRTSGTPLSDSELATVTRACDMTLRLDRAKKILTDYVQSRMSLFAPNLTTLIGSLTAAQLLNYTGGITGLAKTPACNLAPLGSKKNASAIGMATNTGIRHQGFLYHNDIIREVPTDLKVQAMRILAAKIVLAARIDQAHEAPAGEQGLAFYDAVEKRIAKLSEAPPNKGVRALPAPDDKPARKRGGRRARKAKEATAMTDLRKAQNRMAFGKEEAEVGFGDSTRGLGMIGQQDDGRVRAQQVDPRTRAKLGKKNAAAWGAGVATPAGTASSLRGFGGGAFGGGTPSALKSAGLRTAGVGMSSGLRTNVGGTPSGTTSTIAFTPVQGLELVDPKVRAEMARKRGAEEDRWFKGGTFTQISGGGGGGGGGGSGPVKTDSAGFKVPALPSANKKVKMEQGG